MLEEALDPTCAVDLREGGDGQKIRACMCGVNPIQEAALGRDLPVAGGWAGALAQSLGRGEAGEDIAREPGWIFSRGCGGDLEQRPSPLQPRQLRAKPGAGQRGAQGKNELARTRSASPPPPGVSAGLPVPAGLAEPRPLREGQVPTPPHASPGSVQGSDLAPPAPGLPGRLSFNHSPPPLHRSVGCGDRPGWGSATAGRRGGCVGG